MRGRAGEGEGRRGDVSAEEALADLEALANDDKGYAEFKSTLSPLRALLNKKKDADLITSIEEIRDELALKILSRYHDDNAMKFVSFEKDQEVQEALTLFKDMPRYKSILAGK